MAVKGRVYAGVDASERQSRRRSQLLEAALDCFGDGGFAAITVRQVCARAGITHRYFYENFKDRGALLCALYDELAAALIELIVRSNDDLPPEPRERVRAGLVAAIAMLEEDPRAGRYLIVEAPSEPVLAERREATVRWFAEVMRELAKETWQGRIDQQRMVAPSLMVVGGFTELLSWWLADPSRIDRNELIEQGVEMYIAVSETALID